MAQTETAAGSLSVLSVVWFKILPPVFGGQKGIALFNEALGKRLPLLCLCARNNERITASYQIRNILPAGKSQFLNPFCWQKIIRIAKEQKASHLILEFPYYGFAGWLCRKLLRTKLILHAHNIEFLRFKEQQKRWWKALYFLEKWTFNQADAVFVKSEKDRSLAIEYFGTAAPKITLLPFGVSPVQKPEKSKARELLQQRHGLQSQEKIFLFAGTLDYTPNAEAVENIHRFLIPLLNEKGFPYRIIVCGRIVQKNFFYLKNLQRENLLFAGNVEDIATYFSAADVFLNPVSSGGGVQTKTADALCYDLNVVCFSAMTEGISGAGCKLFTVPQNNWPLFADATISALQQNEPTPKEFFLHHDWSKIAEKAFRVIQTT